MPIPKLPSRYERGKENAKGKVKIPWKNPLKGAGGTDFLVAEVKYKNKGLFFGVNFKF